MDRATVRTIGSWGYGIFVAFLFFLCLDAYALLPKSEGYFGQRFWFSLIAYPIIRLLIAAETKLDSK